MRQLVYSDRGKSGSALQLWQQVYKYMRNANAGSITTRESHFNKLSTFCDFVGDQFRLQKLDKLNNKHILAYIDESFKSGVSASQVWNTVSAIQYLIRQMPGDTLIAETRDIKTKYIEQQKKANITFERSSIQRHYIGTGKNPSWTDSELERATQLAIDMKRYDVALSLQFGLTLGARLHETFRQNRTSIEKALQFGVLTTKGKGGLIRDIPASSTAAQEVLRMAYNQTNGQNERPFVPSDQQTHKAMKRIQNWIYNHREKFADRPDRKLTYHGLRHTYAQREFERIERETNNPREALLRVAEQMGHHRAWITKVYLSS